MYAEPKESLHEFSHFAFSPLESGGETWDLAHLTPFALRVDIGLPRHIDAVILFSCHCFTHSIARDKRDENDIPKEEVYDDGRERRVLNRERYEFSKTLLIPLVQALPERHIVVANYAQRNFMTWEVQADNGEALCYGVFFDVEKDRSRQHRVIVRIQSAYILENGLTQRQRRAKKVRWPTLVKATYEGRKIRP